MKFDYSENIQQNKTVTFSGKILFGLTGGIAVGLTVVCAAFVAPAFRRFCLPYVPATPQQISNVLKCLPSSMRTTKERLLDIGSGDGRIVITVARHGMQADGVELNRWLVLYSRWMAFYHNVTYKTNFIRKDLWKFDLQPYNYIVIFGVDSMMTDLENKILNEAPKSKVIACRFPLPNLKPIQTIDIGVNTVWLYDLSKLNEN